MHNPSTQGLTSGAGSGSSLRSGRARLGVGVIEITVFITNVAKHYHALTQAFTARHVSRIERADHIGSPARGSKVAAALKTNLSFFDLAPNADSASGCRHFRSGSSMFAIRFPPFFPRSLTCKSMRSRTSSGPKYVHVAVMIAVAVAVVTALHCPTLSNVSDRPVLSATLPKVTFHALATIPVVAARVLSHMSTRVVADGVAESSCASSSRFLAELPGVFSGITVDGRQIWLETLPVKWVS